MLESCTGNCGWIAALIAALSFGTFGVPWKYDDSCRNTDPLIFMTYNTLCLFASSLFVYMYWMTSISSSEQDSNNSIRFTPWGILTGLFWMPAGLAGISAVRNAGLAISQGLWSSAIVIVSFIWGIAVFHESVRSIFGTCLAGLLIICGIWGLSNYSSPSVVCTRSVTTSDAALHVLQSTKDTVTATSEEEEDLESRLSQLLPVSWLTTSNNGLSTPDTMMSYGSCSVATDVKESSSCSSSSAVHVPFSASKAMPSDLFVVKEIILTNANSNAFDDVYAEASHVAVDHRRLFCDFQFTKRQKGLAAAVLRGVLVGTMLVPLHFSGEESHGLEYVFSFGVGAMIVLLCTWFMKLAYYAHQYQCTLEEAYEDIIPKAVSTFIAMRWPGLTSGMLGAIGNICGILSVSSLGYAVGNSVNQSAILVCGLWGIICFKEVTGWDNIRKWFLFALVTIFGIGLLSHEHSESSIAKKAFVHQY